jgi:hypothetical protein
LDTSLHPLSPRRGRPRKFSEPSKAVTLTLPVSVLQMLSAIDHDVSRAIVHLAGERQRHVHPPAELIAFGRRAVIVVNRATSLERKTGVTLVPFSDGRALICFDGSMTPARLELLVQDALDEGNLIAEDLAVYEGIRDVLKQARRSATVAVQQRQIMVLEIEHSEKRATAAPQPSD